MSTFTEESSLGSYVRGQGQIPGFGGSPLGGPVSEAGNEHFHRRDESWTIRSRTETDSCAEELGSERSCSTRGREHKSPLVLLPVL